MFLLLAIAVFAGQSDFAQLSATAASARESNDLPRAATLYRQALELNDKWTEGWWSLGSVLYDLNRYPEAIVALRKFTELSPNDATGVGLLGLCEFETGDYSSSLKDLSRSLSIGLPGQDQMEGVLRYHEALLLAHNSQFDDALRQYCMVRDQGRAPFRHADVARFGRSPRPALSRSGSRRPARRFSRGR